MDTTAMLRRVQETPHADEMNDYDDDEDDDAYSGEQETIEQLEVEFARAVFGDAHGPGSRSHAGGSAKSTSIRSARDLEEDKLLDMLQRRLFPSSDGLGTLSYDRTQQDSTRSSMFSNKSGSLYSKDGHTRTTTMSSRSGRSFAVAPQRQSSNTGQRKHQYDPGTYTPVGPAADTSISPEKVQQMVQRFRLQEEKTARKLAARRQEAASKELLISAGGSACRLSHFTDRLSAYHSQKTGFTFTPSLNKKSRRLTGAMPTFLERQTKLLALKQHQRDWHARLQEQERNLDLEAHVKTPCICNCRGTHPASPSKLVSSSATSLPTMDATMHTTACLRFMEMCQTMNHSFAIQRKKDQMKRSIDDMMAYHEDKKLRQQARTEIARAQEAAETTFTPQINPRSEKIYAELVRSGRLQSELAERMLVTRKPTPSVPRLTFQPTISKRSKALLHHKKKERDAAKQRAVGDPRIDRDFNNINNSNIDQGDDDDDVFARLQKSRNAKNVNLLRRGDAVHLDMCTSEQPAPPPVEWNVLTFDAAKHGFVLANFNLHGLAA
ncbi:hypothetical protein FI667_g86, partial [Globisporangium splendens]